MRFASLSLLLITCFMVTFASQTRSFNGTWCAKDQGLNITFSSKDSIAVSGISDTSIHGKGTYTRTDSTFIATVLSSGMTMKMGYRYSFKSDSLIKAQAIFITVDGDSVEHPVEWMQMLKFTPVKKIVDTKKSSSKSQTTTVKKSGITNSRK